MRDRFQLTAARPSQAVNLSFDAVAMVVVNLTGSPIYVRVGSNEIPSEASADWLVPAAGTTCLPVVGRWFGVTFGDVAMVNDQGDDVTSGLLGTAIILLLDKDEIIPTFGSVSYLSLSLSDLTNGLVAFSGTTVSTTFDLSAWGGAIIGLQPAVGSGQGVVSLSVSDDAVTFRQVAVYAFWPNVPATFTVPRTVRYLRVTLNATAIVGEPTISGFYSVRATIAEVTQLSYTPIGSSITKAYTAPVSSGTSYTFVTVGLPAVSVGINNATGTRGQLIVEASQSASGPWRLVAEREQSLATVNNSIYRSLGELDLFTRVRILDTGATGLTGTLTMSIPGQPDFTGMLQNIYSALGDTRQTPNVNQSIYHELDTLRISNAAILTQASAINTNTGTIPTINANIAAILTQASAINTNTGTIPTINANIADIETDVDTLLSYKAAVGATLAPSPGVPVAGVWVYVAAFVGNAYVTGVKADFIHTGAGGGGRTLVALGNIAAPSTIIYGSYYNAAAGSTAVTTGDYVTYHSPRAAGQNAFQSNNLNHVWVQSTGAAGQISLVMTYL